MIISQEDARTLLKSIRQAKRDLKALLEEVQPCDRAKGVLLALDVAELLVCDETTHEYREPGETIILQKMLKALGLFKGSLIDRIAENPGTDSLFH